MGPQMWIETHNHLRNEIYINTNSEISDTLFPDVPTKPQGPIEVSDIMRDSVTLHWKPPKDDGGSNILSYIVERRDAKRTTWVKVTTVDGDVLLYNSTGLVEGTSYHFRISAENEVGVSEALDTDAAVIPKSPYGMFLSVTSGLRLDSCCEFR